MKYLNEKLGGIDGHPVKFATCYISTSAELSVLRKTVNQQEVHAIATAIHRTSRSCGRQRPEADGQQRRHRRRRPDEQERLRAVRRRHPRSGPFATYAARSSGPRRSRSSGRDPWHQRSSQAIVDGAKKLGLNVEQCRLEPERDRPRRPADGGRCPDSDAIIANSSEGLHQPLQGAAVAEDRHAGRVGAAVHQRGRRQAIGTSPADVRHRPSIMSHTADPTSKAYTA